MPGIFPRLRDKSSGEAAFVRGPFILENPSILREKLSKSHVICPMRITLALFALLSMAAAKERWLYLPANHQVDAEVDRVIALLERAKSAGYNHALLADSKFSRLGTLPDRYFTNLARVKETASKLGIDLVPAVFPVGYSNDLLFHDPNLAEGLPVREARFVVRNGIATITAEPDVHLNGGSMKDLGAWTFGDESLKFIAGVAHSPSTAENARLNQKLKVSPFRQYHVSVRIRSKGLMGGTPEIKALGADGRSLQWTNLKVDPDQDWTQYDVTFNSLENHEIGLYFGIWGGHQGDVWWNNARIEECGLVNLLRRPGTPLRIFTEEGKPLKEGIDFEAPADPLLGNKPWPGEFTPWHEPPPIRTHGIAEGSRLKVSYFHAQIIHDGQVCACVCEPAFQSLLGDQASRIHAEFRPKSFFMSHDEWRVIGWDESCAKRNPGRIAADNLHFCTELLRKTSPASRILVWSDMFDPHHNAVKQYYLANGSLEGSWEGLDPSVTVMNWNFGKRNESLGFFANRGNHQIIAGFYDEPLENVSRWLESAKDIDHIDGFMYTTWKQDYSKLEEVTKLLERHHF